MKITGVTLETIRKNSNKANIAEELGITCLQSLNRRC